MARELELDDLKGPAQPKPFYGSVSMLASDQKTCGCREEKVSIQTKIQSWVWFLFLLFFFFDGWVAALEGTCLLWGKVLTPKSL